MGQPNNFCSKAKKHSILGGRSSLVVYGAAFVEENKRKPAKIPGSPPLGLGNQFSLCKNINLVLETKIKVFLTFREVKVLNF